MNKLSLILLLSAFSSCNNNESLNNNAINTQDTIRIDTIFLSNGNIGTILRNNKRTNELSGRSEYYYPSGELMGVKYFYNDSANGNSIEYYQNGKIKKFAYLCQNGRSPYIKEYDSSGKIQFELGTPFVNYEASGLGTDTLRLKLFISDFGYENIVYEISPDGKEYSSLPLKKGIIEGSQVVKLWKPIKGLKHTSVYMKITCTDSLSNKNIYTDTLNVY